MTWALLLCVAGCRHSDPSATPPIDSNGGLVDTDLPAVWAPECLEPLSQTCDFNPIDGCYARDPVLDDGSFVCVADGDVHGGCQELGIDVGGQCPSLDDLVDGWDWPSGNPMNVRITRCGDGFFVTYSSGVACSGSLQTSIRFQGETGEAMWIRRWVSAIGQCPDFPDRWCCGTPDGRTLIPSVAWGAPEIITESCEELTVRGEIPDFPSP